MARVILAALLAAALLGAGAPARAADAVKIAYIDAQKVLDATKAGKRAKEAMEEFVKSRQKIIDLDEGDIKRLQEELAKQASVLSEEARRGKEEALQKKFGEYQKRVAELNKEVQNRKKEILEDFNKGLEGVVRKVAEKGGYTFVFDRAAEGGVLVYAKDTYDLTADVIKELDKSAQ